MSRIGGEEALQILLAGNRRYVVGQPTHVNRTLEHRAKLAAGQHPFAGILGCADSRVPPEIVFDQGLGDLFVVRNAGNIADDVVLGSLEYAAAHLGVHLIMVLGHARCGAVDAALRGNALAGHIGSVIESVWPAVEKARDWPGDMLNNAIRANVEGVVNQLRTSEPILAQLVKAGQLKIVGACYDLEAGRVTLIS